MKKNKHIYLLIILFLVLSIACIFINIGNQELISYEDSKIYISEILSNNKTTIADSDNEYSDYIELYNDFDSDINLKGYYLTDSLTGEKKWSFPDIIIKSKEYLIIYASGKDKCNIPTRECHTNFKLNKKGETITLLNSNGKIIDKVKYNKIEQNDTSLSLIKNEYKLTIATPYSINEDIKVDTNIIIDVIINEVSINTIDSIELKNITDTDINLNNYSLKDKNGNTYKFKETIIKANSYLVVYGSDEENIIDNKIYIGFHINNSNEILYLYKYNQLMDKFAVGKMNDNISKGRTEDLKDVIYKDITIGKNNSKTYYHGFSQTPTFSINGGYVEKGTKVELTVDNDSVIYYTLDGSIPTTKSKKYIEPITIDKNIVIKAISYKEGYIESDVESRTYLVGRKHDLPVVSISTNNNYLYGSNGILTTGPNASAYYPYYGANFWKDIEVPISFEYYENGIIGLQFNAGMEIYGNWSRGESQKSFDIIMRKKYGQGEITYPFFESNINTFGGLILRSSGQDWGDTKIKDAFLHKVLDGQMDIDKQDYKSVVVYINGKYYGVYHIREKTNRQYIENHHNAKDKNIDLIRSQQTVLEGTANEYEKLLNYIKTNDMKTEEAYKYLDSQIDLQELINYQIVETYFGNTDPGNMKFYKVEGGKWRWILFDLDNAFYASPSNSSYTPTIRWDLPFSSYVPGHDYKLNPTIMKNIIKNPKIREMYIKTWSQHLKTTFKPERMIKILDQMVKDIETEMPYQIDRWYSESIYTSRYVIKDMNHWRNNISNFKKAIINRYNYAMNNIQKGLGLTDEEYQKYFKD